MSRGDGVGVGLHQFVKRIRRAGLRGEVVHFVVQQEPGGASYVRTVTVVQCVRAGDRVSCGVDHGEMRGVAPLCLARNEMRRSFRISGGAANVRSARRNRFARRGFEGIDR